MLSVALCLLLGQSTPIKAAVPALSVSGIEPGLAVIYLDRFSSTLASAQLRVTTDRDIAQALGFERQKQLLGCADSQESCLVELAGALGVDVLVTGSVGKLESGYLVTLRALKATNGQALASLSHRALTEAAMLDWLDEAAGIMRAEVLAHFDVGSSAARVWRWVPGLVGVVAAGTGAALVIVANREAADLSGGEGPVTDVGARVARGRAYETSGYVLLGVGAAGLVTSALWLALGGSSAKAPTAVSLQPTAQGAMLCVTGALP
jgi:hypothetical protein